jgi:hypothetical protein
MLRKTQAPGGVVIFDALLSIHRTVFLWIIELLQLFWDWR